MVPIKGLKQEGGEGAAEGSREPISEALHCSRGLRMIMEYPSARLFDDPMLPCPCDSFCTRIDIELCVNVAYVIFYRPHRNR